MNLGDLFMKKYNRYSKQRIDMEDLIYNKRMELIKKIRLKTTRIKPLTKKEEFLFREEEMTSSAIEKDENNYLIIDSMFILSLIPKSNLNKLINGIVKLHIGNPLNGNYFDRAVQKSRIREVAMSFSNYNSSINRGWSHLIALTPKDNKLAEISDLINISLFSVSNDYVGIAFHLKLTDKTKLAYSNLLTKNYKTSTEYTSNITSKYVSKKYIHNTLARNNAIEDFILNIKDEFNNFFQKQLPLVHIYKKKAPISLNIYMTNYNIKSSESFFLNSLYFIDNYYTKELGNVKVHTSQNNKQDNYTTRLWYNTTTLEKTLDRSVNLYYYIKDENTCLNITSNDYVDFFLVALGVHGLKQMSQEISQERNVLYNLNPNKMRKNYKHYKKFNTNLQMYNLMFNCFKDYKPEDKNLNDYFKNFKKFYNIYDGQYKNLSKEYIFRMQINNTINAFTFAKLSIIIALIGLLLQYWLNTHN